MSSEIVANSSLLYPFLSSFAACVAIVASFSIGYRAWVRNGDDTAVQCAHSKPTPRIGGVALVVALLVFAAFVPETLLNDYFLFCLTLLPVFAAGLAEDLGIRVSPRNRLIAAALSSVFVIVMFQVWLVRADIPLLDPLIAFAPFAIALTVLVGATACNAFNLIDGVNGLSAGTAVMTALGMSVIAYGAGDTIAAQAGMILVAALAGFLVLNYPFGKIFLGDAGAYSIGHILVWFAIILIVRLDNFSPLAALLLFFWPAADTVFSIYRRRLRRRAITQPDRLHYHQFVMRALEVLWLGRNRRHIANPLSTLVMMPLVAAPVAAGVLFWNDPGAAAVALMGFSALFVASYAFGIRFAARRGRPRQAKPQLVPGE
ncbi:MAG: glycosyltransferase family 4 protein [Pararhodobacter sp.]|nr:glycosyltransferase family 4 protein [Pararhodobacter sp.]